MTRARWVHSVMVALLSCSFAATVAVSKPPSKTAQSPAPATDQAPVVPEVTAPSHPLYHATHPTDGAKSYYAGVWGISNLRVQMTGGDNLVKFTWKVLDPKRAAPIGEHSEKPELVALRTNAVLQVPTMEKVGPLRQATVREAGKEYWMLFSNKGHPVHSGDRVNIIIGKFRALDLVVE